MCQLSQTVLPLKKSVYDADVVMERDERARSANVSEKVL